MSRLQASKKPSIIEEMDNASIENKEQAYKPEHPALAFQQVRSTAPDHLENYQEVDPFATKEEKEEKCEECDDKSDDSENEN